VDTDAADATPVRKRIFYGDLHTHSNLSLDAFLFQTYGKVSRGPEAACTFARACAQVDFYGQSDHAEMLHGEAWRRSQDAVKACNAAAAAAAPAGGEPDLVAFQGFEWTSSAVAEAWGHKNVFFANDAVPERAIASYAVGEIPVANLRALLTTLRLFGEYDVGLLPPIWLENSPLVLLEHLHAGKFVITSRLGGPPEWVREPGEDAGHPLGNGLLFPGGDADALATQIVRIASGEVELPSPAEVHGATPHLQSYPGHVAEVESIYRELLAARV